MGKPRCLLLSHLSVPRCAESRELPEAQSQAQLLISKLCFPVVVKIIVSTMQGPKTDFVVVARIELSDWQVTAGVCDVTTRHCHLIGDYNNILVLEQHSPKFQTVLTPF